MLTPIPEPSVFFSMKYGNFANVVFLFSFGPYGSYLTVYLHIFFSFDEFLCQLFYTNPRTFCLFSRKYRNFANVVFLFSFGSYGRY